MSDHLSRLKAVASDLSDVVDELERLRHENRLAAANLQEICDSLEVPIAARTHLRAIAEGLEAESPQRAPIGGAR